MPRFLDHHAKNIPMPSQAVIQQVQENKKAKKADSFGMMPIDVHVGKNGEVWCVTEAPNAEAVLKSHQAAGIKISASDITEITSL